MSNEAMIIKETSHGYTRIPIQDEMLPHSRLMIHDPLIMHTGGSALKLKAVTDDLMETRQIIAKVIADHSGKSMEEVLAKTATDSYFRAEEAVEFGLADNIITSLAEHH